jgi:hypothetical protein
MKDRLVLLAWLAAVCATAGFTGAEAGAQSLPAGVSSLDYRRAWPAVVPVRSPDPVLGEDRFLEYWVYDKVFAERFQNFNPAGADPDLAPGVHAIAFRTYKEKVFTYAPDLFRCEYEIYFDSGVQIPPGDPRESSPQYPRGVSPAFQRLRPARQEDAQFLSRASPEKRRAKSMPLILADGANDGRYASFGLSYAPSIVPGISMAVLGRGDFRCRVLAPKRPGSRYWLSLFGELPFNEKGGPGPFNYSKEFMNWLWKGTFDPGPPERALRNGLVLVPEAFYQAVLPKVTLIKAVNQCLIWRSGYERGTIKDIEGSKNAAFTACDAIEKKGEIHEITVRGILKGWQHPAF